MKNKSSWFMMFLRMKSFDDCQNMVLMMYLCVILMQGSWFMQGAKLFKCILWMFIQRYQSTWNQFISLKIIWEIQGKWLQRSKNWWISPNRLWTLTCHTKLQRSWSSFENCLKNALLNQCFWLITNLFLSSIKRCLKMKRDVRKRI